MANIDKNFRVKNGLDVKGTINLAAIAESKSETAVDVFVYDTSKDTDGGAWRHRTQHTSWYNETLNTSTRGSRKEFPAVAVIMAETDKVTIYDGDDPSLPMWMVFNVLTTYTQSMISGGNEPRTLSLSATNGLMSVGAQNGTAGNTGTNGIFRIDFIKDQGRKTSSSRDILYRAGIDKRNASGFVHYINDPNVSSNFIVNTSVNDVAMTVLPDAPIDAATGLPVPTIAVATDGGVSVIKDDGTVVDITYSIANEGFTSHIRFTDDGGLIFNFSGSVGANNYIYVFDTLPTADNLITVNSKTGSSQNADALYTTRLTKIGNADLALLTGVSNATAQLYALTTSEAGTALGLSNFYTDPTAPANGMVAYTTSDYNTGWINGDIKGAFLSDTDDTNLVGSGELVTNGDDFNGVVNGTSTLPTGATNVGWYETSNGTYSVTNGVLTITIGTNGRTGFYWPISVVQGALYEAEWVAQTGNIQVRITDSIDPNDTTPLRIFNLGSTGKKTFVSPSSTLYVSVTNYDAGQGDVGTLDKISVKLADADRSVNNNALIVNGTVTRTAVATGADLVAYSGFSTSNYLEQPYNSDLDFGTGDFCYMGWFKTTDTQGILFCRADSSLSATQFRIFINSRKINTTCGSATVVATDGLDYNAGNWNFVTVVRRSGVEHVYANGEQIAVRNRAGSVTNTSATLRQGVAQNDSSPLVTGSLALWRISATAPTAAQIKKIYEDEKFLFQENAQATLYGTSDAVTALGHDEDTGLLHVGTSAGRSVFQGLRRVDNTTDAVGTAISAVGGLVVEE